MSLPGRRKERATAPPTDLPYLPILEACPVGLVLFDADGDPVVANGGAKSFCPDILDRLAETPGILPARPSSGPCSRKTTALDTFRPGEPPRAERVWTHPDPDARGYLRIWRPQPSAEPACAHLDQVQAEFRRAVRMRNELLANVTHELRTPVNAVIGYSDLLLDDVCGPLAPKQKETVEYLRDAAEGLLRLINDLLTASRIEAGRSDLILSTFRIDHLVEEVIRNLQPLYAAKGLRLRVNLHEPAERLRSDRGKCKQILVNLLSNAVKFTPRGEIAIGTFAAGTRNERLGITVRDTGIGIPPGEIESIFEMFRQVDNGTAREHEGSGLGLYLSRRLADLLGATITAESRVGEGSAFTLLMPRRLGDAMAVRRVRRDETSRATARPGDDAAGPLVLLVGSSDDEGRILGSILRAEGMRIEEVSDPADAIEAARTLRPATIVLDIEDDPEAGWESYRRLKADPSTCETPLVFLTDTLESTSKADTTVLACQQPFDRYEVTRAMRRARLRQHPARILVVDDEETMCAAVGELLEAEGFQVSQAATGTEAVRKTRAERPDLVLLDLRLPDISGWDVIRRISDIPELRHTKIIILTGMDLSPQEVESLRNVTTGLMTKDQFRVERLIAQLDAVLEQPSPGTHADHAAAFASAPVTNDPPRRGSGAKQP